MLRLGIGSWTLPWAIGAAEKKNSITAEDLILYAKEKGVGIVQICDNVDLLSYSDEKLENLYKLAVDNSIELQLGCKGISYEILKDYLRIAKMLKVNMIRTLTDNGDDQPVLETVIRRLSAVKKDFEDAGVVLAIENHDRFTAKEYKTIMQRVNSDYIGICFDTANSIAQLEDYDTCFRYMKDYIKNFHIKEFKISRIKGKMGFLVVGAPLGQGGLEVKRIIDDLKALGRDIDVILEQWPPFEQDEKKTVALEKSWADSGIELLKGLI